MVNKSKPFELNQQDIDNLNIEPSLSKEYPETGYNFQDTNFLASYLAKTHNDCAFIDTKEILLSETYIDIYDQIQNSINGKSNVVTGEIFINKNNEMLMLAPILANTIVEGAKKIVCPLTLTYPPKEPHGVAFCMNANDDGSYNAVIIEQHAQNKEDDIYIPQLDYTKEVFEILNKVSSFFDGYGIIINTQHNEKPICRETNVCGIVSIEACKRLLEADNPAIIAKEGFTLTNEDIVELHKENINKYHSEKTQNIDYDLSYFPEMHSFDMLDDEKQVGDMQISIHRKKTAERGEKQIYPDLWFIEGSNILKPVLEIDGFGTIGNQGGGYGRAGLQRAYEMSIEKGCEGRIEVHATWGAGSFYEHCGFSGKNKGEPGIKCFDPTPENIASLYKGGKRENLTLQITKPIDLSDLNLDELTGEFIDPNELSTPENIETLSPLQEKKSTISEIQKVLERKQEIDDLSQRTTTNLAEVNHSIEQTPQKTTNIHTSNLKYLKEITTQNG